MITALSIYIYNTYKTYLYIYLLSCVFCRANPERMMEFAGYTITSLASWLVIAALRGACTYSVVVIY